MKTVMDTDFRRNFGAYQRYGQQEPIEVTSRGQVVGYFISPEAFERYLSLSAAARRAYHPGKLPAHLKHAVRMARMDLRGTGRSMPSWMTSDSPPTPLAT